MYHQLTEQERYTLSVLHRDGQSLRATARLLGRAPSTISREVRRNRCHWSDGVYRPSKAQEQSGRLQRPAVQGHHLGQRHRVPRLSGVRCYFAYPHHPWERDSNENFNGLLRQYLPKQKSLARISQAHCDRITHKLDTRLRKRHGYKTPIERLHELSGVLHLGC